MKNIFLKLALIFCCTPNILFSNPTIGNVSFASASPMYDKFEVTFNLTASYVNPYDPTQIDIYAEFWSPSNKYYKINAFFYNEVTDCGCKWINPCPVPPHCWQEQQTISLSPIQNWKVRFTPNEYGSWKFRITGIDNTGIGYDPSSSTLNSFSCSSISATPSNKGFIKVANQRYLKFENESPFIPVGNNAPFFSHNDVISPGDPRYVEGGTCKMKNWMNEMVANNINFFRYEINFFYAMNLIGIDYRDGKNYYSYFNQLDSWQLDEIMDYAHLKGIYLDLMIFSHSDLGNKGYCKNKWNDYNPFYEKVRYEPLLWNKQGVRLDKQGTCKTPYDFLTKKDAIEIQKNLLRYIIARWSYSNNILSFELLDEVDQFPTFDNLYPPTPLPPHPPTHNTDLINWHLDLKNYINSIDPYKHLICTGYKNINENDGFLLNNLMDYTQGKVYTNQGPPNWWSDSQGFSNNNFETETFKVSSNFNKKHFKPFFLVEIGYFSDNYFVLPNYDKSMYGLHGLLWSSLFSGAIGPSCFWTHDEITYEKPNAIKNFQGVGKFAQNLPLLSEKFEPISTKTNQFKVFYLKSINNDAFYGWLQDLNFDFLKILRSIPDNSSPGSFLPHPYLQSLALTNPNKPTFLSLNNSIVFSSAKNGIYSVEWFETETGNLLSTVNSTVTNNVFSLVVPQNLLSLSKYGDLAFKIKYICVNQWNNTVLNSTSPSNVKLVSDIETDVNGNVYFVGIDNRLHIMYHNGAIWVEATLNGNALTNVRPGSDLARGVFEQINFIGTDNKIHQYYWSGTTWIETPLCVTTNNVRATSPVHNPLVCDSYGSVYYISQGNKIHNYSFNQTAKVWEENVLSNTTGINARLDSDLAIDSKNNLYYVGIDNLIHTYYWNFSLKNWVGSPLNSVVVKAGSSLACDQQGRVYFIANAGNRIQRYFKNNLSQWVLEDFYPSAPSSVIKQNSDMTITQDGTIFFVGADNRIHNYWYNGSSWTEATLNSNDPMNAKRFLTSDLNGNVFYGSENVNASGNRIFVDYFNCHNKF